MSSIYSNIENAQSQSKTKVAPGYNPELDPMVGLPIAPARQKSSRGMKWAIFLSLLFSAVAISCAVYLYFQLQASADKRSQLERQVDQLSKTSQSLETSTAKTLGEFDSVRRKVDEMSSKYETVQDDINNNRFEISAVQRTVFDLQDRATAMTETLNQIKNKILFDPFSSSNTDANPASSTTLPTVVSIDQNNTASSGPVWQVPDSNDQGWNNDQTVTTTGSASFSQNNLPSQRYADGSISQQPITSSFETPATPVYQAPVIESNTTSSVIVTTGPKVMTINKKFNFIVLNLGLKDGLKMGDQLEVQRGNESIGRVEVEKLYDDFAAATIVKQKNNDEIQEGDQIVR